MVSFPHTNPAPRPLLPSLLTLALTLALTAMAGTATAGKSVHVGDQAPDWILTDSQGKTVSFYRDSNDQPAVLIFWATWCPYCAELLPEMEALRQELGADVRFYALNIWEDGDPIGHMKKNNFGFHLLLDADKVAKRYAVHGTPGLFVVGGDKTVRYIRTKGTTAEAARDAVKQALESL